MNTDLIIRICWMTIVSTTLMTAFSYYFSWLRNKQFKEPEILNELLWRLRLIKGSGGKNHPAGWTIHYVVGFIFVIAYHIFWNKTEYEPTFGTSILLGALSGVIGVVGWRITFGTHPDPPTLDFKEYYVQLLIAHIIFGAGAYLGNL